MRESEAANRSTLNRPEIPPPGRDLSGIRDDVPLRLHGDRPTSDTARDVPTDLDSFRRHTGQVNVITPRSSVSPRPSLPVHAIHRNGRPDSLPDRDGRPADSRGPQLSGPDRERHQGLSGGAAGAGAFTDARRQRYHDFQHRIESGQLDSITRGSLARKLDFDRQFRYHSHGDVTRQLGLHQQFVQHGDWRRDHYCGRTSSTYLSVHFGHTYCGPRWYPSRVWWPRWTDWVDWCWWDTCHSVYDPRPVYCRPVVYQSCPQIVVYSYPVWQPLYEDRCGTWVDVPPVRVPVTAYDLQLLAVRFVDSGHPDKQLGPRYRIWLRNNAAQDLTTSFNVSLVASNDGQLSAGLPQAGVRVEAMKAGETESVDVRLPWAVYSLSRNADGAAAPFVKLHAIVDSHGEIEETSEENNGAVLDRETVLPVDPAAFATDVDTVALGGQLSIAGEGFGPEPGQVVVYVRGLELQSEIHGWYDLGVRFQVPTLPLAQAEDAEIVVVRGDGVASNPVTVKLTPAGIELLPAPMP